MNNDKKTWISGIWQTLLGAAVIGAWGIWWTDRDRITKLENEKEILKAKYDDEIQHLKSAMENDNKTIWREIIIHENMLRGLDRDIIEVKTTKEVILSLARPPDEWTGPIVPPPMFMEEDPAGFQEYEQRAAEIDDKALKGIIEQKGRRQQQQQQQQQAPQGK